MERVEDHLLHDEEGSDLKEEDDYGYESDDEEREASEEVSGQSHVVPSSSSSSSSSPFKECGTSWWLWLQEYEFSCSNSPSPVFFHVPKSKYHFNFPCINHPQVIEEDHNKAVVLVPKTPEYTFNFRFDASDYLSPGDRRSPLQSPFSVRITIIHQKMKTKMLGMIKLMIRLRISSEGSMNS